MRARACWALPVFVKVSSFYVFSRLDLCVRGWRTRKNTSGSSVGGCFLHSLLCFRLFRPRWKAILYVKNVCARVLGFACFRQNVDRIRGSGRLSELRCNKIHGSGRLGAQTYDKIRISGCLRTQKFAKIHGSGRPKGAGFWCLPGVPPTSGQKRSPERLFFS
jgi:hypothetical protein